MSSTTQVWKGEQDVFDFCRWEINLFVSGCRGSVFHRFGPDDYPVRLPSPSSIMCNVHILPGPLSLGNSMSSTCSPSDLSMKLMSSVLDY